MPRELVFPLRPRWRSAVRASSAKDIEIFDLRIACRGILCVGGNVVESRHVNEAPQERDPVRRKIDPNLLAHVVVWDWEKEAGSPRIGRNVLIAHPVASEDGCPRNGLGRKPQFVHIPDGAPCVAYYRLEL